MSDNTPDFDKMTPDEIMSWMETLAKRQGASEGFTTAADMDIAEIDPDTVVIDEPGYVPYGQERTQPLAAQPAAPEKPATIPPETARPPQPATMPAAQTPPAPMPIPPQTPPIIKPLNVPASPPQQIPTPAQAAPPAAQSRAPIPPPQTIATPPAAQSRPPIPAQTQTPAPIPPPQAVATPPAAQSRPPIPAQTQTPAPIPPPQTVATPPAAQSRPPIPAQTPAPILAPQAAPPLPPTPQPAPSEEGGLAWLESLAADQSDSLFNLDLSGFPTAAGETTTAAAQPVNPMNWLEDLARSQTAEPSLEKLGADEADEDSEKLDPYAEGVNPMEWLETLARRQGAKQEELTTPASMNIPTPHEAEVEQVDYQPFSFDTPPTRRTPEPATLENPADWLNSLAGAEGYGEEGVPATQKAEAEPEPSDALSMPTIEDAIASGTVTREQMQFFLDQQADQLAQQPEEDYPQVAEVEEPLAPAELPDWLSELKPEPPAPEPTKPIDTLFETPAAAVDMPDWLRQDLLSDDASADLSSIFEPEEDSRPFEPIVQNAAPPFDLDVDSSDPWVEAFDEEYAQGGSADVSAVPEWYDQNVHDPGRIAAVEGHVVEEAVALTPPGALAEAALPEESGLPVGQLEAVPDWMTGVEHPETEEEQPAAIMNEEMPDWLKEVEASVTPEEVPSWLVETITAQDDADITQKIEPVQPPAAVEPPPAPRAIPVPPPPPARASVADSEAAAVLERARDREQSGDLEGALTEYESMIRSSVHLDHVVADLSLLVKSYKTTPAVYRVLGDGLMRQGKLQAALNTYREALNQL